MRNVIPDNWWKSSWFYKVMAILLAIALWVFVAQTQNPVEEAVFDVPVEFVNMPDDLAVSEYSHTVKVRVSGTSSVLDNVLSRDISATVDMTDAHVGQYVGRIVPKLPENVELVSITPVDIVVQVQDLKTVQMPVSIVYENADVADGYMALDAQVWPSEISISGPADKVEAIGSVYALVSLNKASDDYSATLPVYVAGKDGSSLNLYMTLEPDEAEVWVPIVKDSPETLLPVKANLVGEPASGYSISRVEVDPAVVTVAGEYEVLAALAALKTQPIDISGATSDVSAKVSLQMPVDVSVDIKGEVSVLVVIDRQVTKEFTDVPLVVKKETGYEYLLSADKVNLLIKGASTVLSALNDGDLVAHVDVANLQEGEYSLPVQVDLPVGASLSESEPAKVTVKIRAKD